MLQQDAIIGSNNAFASSQTLTLSNRRGAGNPKKPLNATAGSKLRHRPSSGLQFRALQDPKWHSIPLFQLVESDPAVISETPWL